MALLNSILGNANSVLGTGRSSFRNSKDRTMKKRAETSKRAMSAIFKQSDLFHFISSSVLIFIVGGASAPPGNQVSQEQHVTQSFKPGDRKICSTKLFIPKWSLMSQMCRRVKTAVWVTSSLFSSPPFL